MNKTLSLTKVIGDYTYRIIIRPVKVYLSSYSATVELTVTKEVHGQNFVFRRVETDAIVHYDDLFIATFNKGVKIALNKALQGMSKESKITIWNELFRQWPELKD